MTTFAAFTPFKRPGRIVLNTDSVISAQTLLAPLVKIVFFNGTETDSVRVTEDIDTVLARLCRGCGSDKAAATPRRTRRTT
jgi:hypothetical protein